MGTAFGSLTDRRFRWFAAAAFIASTHLWAFWVAQTWLIIELTHADPMWVGATAAAQLVPVFVVGLIGGIMADRFRKIRILAVCDGLIGILAIVSAVLVELGSIRPALVLATALAAGTCTALSQPSRQSMPAEIVTADQLVSAMSMTSSMVGIGRIIGPLLAALVLAIGDVGVLFGYVGIAASACAVALFVLFTRADGPVPPVDRAQGGPRTGLGLIRQRPDLMTILSVMMVVCALGWNSQVLIALVAERTFTLGASGFATLTAVFAVGGVLGTIHMARRPLPTLQALAGQCLAMGLLTAVTGFSVHPAWYAAALVPLGYSAFGLAVAVNVTFIGTVAAESHGRVMAVVLVFTQGSAAIGGPILGLLARELGPRGAYVGSGLIIVLALAAAVAVTLSRGQRSKAF